MNEAQQSRLDETGAWQVIQADNVTWDLLKQSAVLGGSGLSSKYISQLVGSTHRNSSP